MPPGRPLNLKSWQLKYSAFLMGLTTTGTKVELDSSLRHHLYASKRPFDGGRIVSVDMGIRNLAYCVLDVPTLDAAQRHGKKPFNTPITVSNWRRKDLLSPDLAPEQSPEQLAEKAEVVNCANGSGRRRKTALTTSIPKAAFTPSVLSATAYSVVTDLLSYKPNVILIERQRFRSGGAAAIQEWTVRVNMLESMLWACLHTMCETRSTATEAFPTIHGVSPAKVAKFWTAAPDIDLRPRENLYDLSRQQPSPVASLTRKKVQKKDKIATARSWLDDSDDVSLNFEGEAAETTEAFRRQRGRVGGRADSHAEASAGKLDDLSDCLLQGMAWLRWEENSRRVHRLLDEKFRTELYGSVYASKYYYEGEFF